MQAQIANLFSNRKKLKDYFVQSPIVHLKSIAHTRSDEAVRKKLSEVIQANIDEQDLDVDKMARLMSMGRTSSFRKIKSITNLTPNELINVTRLKKLRNYWWQEITGFMKWPTWWAIAPKQILAGNF